MQILTSSKPMRCPTAFAELSEESVRKELYAKMKCKMQSEMQGSIEEEDRSSY